MEVSVDESLAAMLSASLTISGLGPVIDAQQASVLLSCSEGHIDRLADSGLLPGTKYGRGWIFVTAQLIHHVVLECAGNIRATETSVVEQVPDTSQCRAEADHKRADAPPPPLVPLELPRRRGRPRRPLLDAR